MNKDIIYKLYKLLILYVILFYLSEFFNGILIAKNIVAYQGMSKIFTVISSIISIIILVKKFGILSLGIGLNIGMFILLFFK